MYGQLSSMKIRADLIDTIVLSSGGPRAFPAFIACIEMLQTQRKLRLSEICRLRGTSAGAIVAFSLAIGLSIYELREQCARALDLTKNMDMHVSNLFTQLGLASSDAVRECVVNALRKRGIPEAISFNDLLKRTGRELCVVATDASNGSQIVFSPSQTPNVVVADGVVASASIPFLMAPHKVHVNGAEIYCVDGAIVSPYPVVLAGERELSRERTLGVRILTMKPKPAAQPAPPEPGIYFWNLASILFAKFEETADHEYVTVDITLPITSATGLSVQPTQQAQIEAMSAIATARVANHIDAFECEQFANASTQTEVEC